MLTLTLLLSCMPASTRAHINSMDQQLTRQQAEIQAQQAQIETLEQQLGSAEQAAGPPTAFQEAAAKELYLQLQAAMEEWNYAQAKELMATLEQDYGRTRVARQASRTKAELSVVGMDAPSLDGIERWYTQAPRQSDTVTVLVFWEEWCPHCRRELPKLSEFEALPGVGVVALTKITKTSTDELVQEFIKENALTYSIGFDADQSISEAYSVTGIPAAAVVRDGVVVWRGHPARLTVEDLEKARDGLPPPPA